MKKRKIAVLLALTLTAASVIGGCNKEEETEKPTETQMQTETPAATEAPTEKHTEKPTEAKESETNKPGESESNQQSESNSQTEAGQGTDGTQSTEGGQTAQTGAPKSTSGSNDEDTQRWFFDKNGNTVYAHIDSNGNWIGDNGEEFYFYEEGVEDSNGVTYYYDPPTGSSGSSGTSGSGTSSSSDIEDPDYYDFYDTNGNHIIARQNEKGEWVDDNGNSYTFGEKGVTDSKGNFHPY
ncbi:hypothetical protein [Murimonas intestini]|uniref:Uncharacterized protein n=1 Tax=Murimonas intestini TaxID=1337051 RepID=A0AB73T4C9_9FIRM|nr:hypothetical protein [Murimonas intestini]MCR1840918.1 hypothetical protein [Murimonas intestini]MCR1865963.1 hypothetical protein [Murimonas intestini]MCR1883383.1 hypothetical protein [Murimonas intestini]